MKLFSFVGTAFFVGLLALLGWLVWIHSAEAPTEIETHPPDAESTLPRLFEDDTRGFSIRYPEGYTADTTYTAVLGPGRTIDGVSFTIPASLTEGTNLSSDTHVSVEQLPDTLSCTADLFLAEHATPETIAEGGATYSFASSTDAAAGNRYESVVYAIPGSQPCTAVRYLIHYGVLQNYPADTVQAFDNASLLRQFDSIRDTLVLMPLSS